MSSSPPPSSPSRPTKPAATYPKITSLKDAMKNPRKPRLKKTLPSPLPTQLPTQPSTQPAKPHDFTSSSSSSGSDSESERPSAPKHGALKMRIVNGIMVLDEESRTIRKVEEEQDQQQEIIESDLTQFTNARTYRSAAKKRRPSPWTDEQTEEFYQLLRKWGGNFEVISRALPGRTRKDIKSKFLKEDKRNPTRMTRVLRESTTMSETQVDELIAIAPDDGLTPEEYREREAAKEAREQKRIQREQRAAKRKFDAENMTEEQKQQQMIRKLNARDRVEKKKNREALMGEEIVEEFAE